MLSLPGEGAPADAGAPFFFPLSCTENIYFAWLMPLPKARIKPRIRAIFAELLKLVDEVDSKWTSEEEWQSLHGCWWTDFSRYPTLAKYLSQVRFLPRARFGGGSKRTRAARDG